MIQNFSNSIQGRLEDVVLGIAKIPYEDFDLPALPFLVKPLAPDFNRGSGIDNAMQTAMPSILNWRGASFFDF